MSGCTRDLVHFELIVPILVRYSQTHMVYAHGVHVWRTIHERENTGIHELPNLLRDVTRLYKTDTSVSLNS